MMSDVREQKIILQTVLIQGFEFTNVDIMKMRALFVTQEVS